MQAGLQSYPIFSDDVTKSVLLYRRPEFNNATLMLCYGIGRIFLCHDRDYYFYNTEYIINMKYVKVVHNTRRVNR